MRAVVRCVLAVVTVAASVVAGPAGTSVAAANQPHDFAIASVLPRRGATVGVAYPVVVTFKAPSRTGTRPSAPSQSSRRPQ